MVESKRKNNGITLMALVITIIVMIVLSAVSINAAIGNNGIITKAQEATFLKNCAILEEYLGVQLITYMQETADRYETDIEYFERRDDSCLYRSPSGFSFIWNDDGQKRFLIDKSKLPDDVRNSINDGNASSYRDFVNLNDVYGVTSDLRVYYCMGDSKIYGHDEDLQIDLDQVMFSGDSAVNKVLQKEDVTIKNLIVKKDIVIDGSQLEIQEVEDIMKRLSFMSNLEVLRLKHVSLDDIEGLNYLLKLKEIYFTNVTVEDYSGIKGVKNLNIFSITHTDDNEMNKLLNAMQGVDYENFAKFSMELSNGAARYYGRNLTDVSCLQLLSDKTKKALTYLKVYYSNITTLDVHGFDNLIELDSSYNTQQVSLSGLSNLKELLTLHINYSSKIDTLDSFPVGSKLRVLRGWHNSITSLDFIKNCNFIYYVDVDNTKLEDITALSGKKYLKVLYLTNDKDVIEVESIPYQMHFNCNTSGCGLPVCINPEDTTAKCDYCGKTFAKSDFENKSKYTYEILHLRGTKPPREQVALMKNIIDNSITYTLPEGCDFLFLDKPVLNLANKNVKLSDMMQLLTVKKDADNNIVYDSDGNVVYEDNETIERLTLSEAVWLDENGEKMMLTLPKKPTETDIATVNANRKSVDDMLQLVLSHMPKMTHLCLSTQVSLTSISFAERMPNLIELLINGTSVTNIAVLDDHCLKLRVLALDNGGTNITQIQHCITRLYENSGNGGYTASGSKVWASSTVSGLWLNNMDLVDQLNSCNQVEKLYLAANPALREGQTIIDISGMTSLTHWASTYNTKPFKFPASVTYLGLYGEIWNKYDVSNITYLDRLYNTESSSAVGISQLFNNFPTGAKIKSIETGYSYANSSIDFSNLDLSATTSISVQNYAGFGKDKVCDITGLSNLQSLTSLSLSAYMIRSVNIIDSAPLLKQPNLNTNKLESLEFLKNCTEITNIQAQNNQLYDLYGLDNLTKLSQINLTNNKLQRKSTHKEEDGTTTPYDNLEILKTLNRTGSLRRVYLAGNQFTEEDYNDSGIKNAPKGREWWGGTSW